MVISKTPVRISFFGGGTDYPEFFKINGGNVISTTIDKFIYVTVNRISGLLDHKYRIAYSKLELCNSIDEITHPVVREVIRLMNIDYGLEINIISDLPARTGIGSSSSFTVGLLYALYALEGKFVGKHQLAMEAIHIEYNILKERVGVQDQLAASYGGLNIMKFDNSGLSVNPLIISAKRRIELEQNLIIFYTGINRYASEILQEQVSNTIEHKIDAQLFEMKRLVDEGLNTLCDENKNLDEFGKLLHESWKMKKSLSSSVSTSFLDEIYNVALHNGAVGGKLLGAGGGGFFLFYVPTSNRKGLIKKLENLHTIDFKFENNGTQIIHYH
jgi:D-glycero-alpha-D-manno-heptose-7-phosphate kinase